MSQTLVRYNEMCRAIAECHAIDEVKDIRDKALALEEYARRAQNFEAEEQARDIRLRAEKECGGRLREMAKAKAGRPPENPSSEPRDFRGAPTLADLNISYDQSSQWQKLAAVPDEMFEQALREPHPSTASIIMRHVVAERGPEPPARAGNKKALWLWGRLQDFEDEGLLDEEPSSMLEGISDHMRVTILEMAPRIATWLKGIGK
jgi:hypothetical protein